MRRRSSSPFATLFDLARLGMDSCSVIGLRMAKLAAGGPAAMLEAQQMVAEKATAAVEQHTAAAIALASGVSHNAVGRQAIRGYQKRVTANRRRLTRKK